MASATSAASAMLLQPLQTATAAKLAPLTQHNMLAPTHRVHLACYSDWQPDLLGCTNSQSCSTAEMNVKQQFYWHIDAWSMRINTSRRPGYG
jgi:hypothetical protein